MEDRSQIWIKIQAWFARAGRATKSGLKRFWAWLPGTMSLTRQHAAQAWALLRQEKLKPVVVVWVLSVVPALLFAQSRAHDYSMILERMQSQPDIMGLSHAMLPQGSLLTFLLEWLLRYVCAPLMYAVLAHLFLGRLRHAPVPVMGTAVEKAKSWKSLVYLALVCVVATQLVGYVPGLLFSLLNMLVSLVAWVPVLGSALSWLVRAVSVLMTHFLSAALVVALFSLFLAAEDLPGQVFPSIIAAWTFLRNHLRSFFGACAVLMVVRWVLVSLPGRSVWLALTGEMLAALVIPLAATAYTAVLYADSGAHSTGDPFAAPDNIDTIKRAN